MRWVTIGAIVAVLLASLSLIAETAWFKSQTDPSRHPWLSRISKRQNNPSNQVHETPNRRNILLIGVDERPDDPGRSDTLMLLSLDPARKQATVISIPRDTWVHIPQHGWDKINHAYAYGKETLVAETVEGLLGIPVDHFVVINLKGFQQVVNTLGGVTVDVEKQMVYDDPYQDLHIDLQPGLQRLNGNQAMQYVRYRADEGADIGRVQRQQKFIRALADEAFHPRTLVRLPALINQLSAAVRTDLSPGDIVRLISPAKEAYERGLQSTVIPGSSRYFYDTSYLVADIAQVRATMANLFGLSAPKPEFIEEITRRYLAALPKEPPPPSKLEAVSDVYREPPGSASGQEHRDTPEVDRTPPPATPKNGPVFELIDATGLNPFPGPKYTSVLIGQGWKISRMAIWQNPRPRTAIIIRTAEPEISTYLGGLFPQSEITVKPEPKARIAVTIILGRDAGAGPVTVSP